MKVIYSAVLFIMLASVAFAQNSYVAQAATTTLTIQQPATNAKAVTLGVGPGSTEKAASVYCAAAQTATLSWNGTAASTTAATVTPIPPTAAASNVAVAFSGSNVGAGTTGPVYTIPAGATFLISLMGIRLPPGNGGSTNNFTITTSGTCTITITWTEQ